MARTEPQAKKVAAVAELQDIIRRANFVGFLGIRGIPARELLAMRRNVKKNDGYFKVAKRSLIWRAAQGTSVPLESDPKEPIALVADFAEDMNALKVLPKQNSSFLFGIFNGKIISKEEVSFLQNLPSKQEIRARLASTAKSTLLKFSLALKALQKRLEAPLRAGATEGQGEEKSEQTDRS